VDERATNFWEDFPELVWSNRTAGDTVYIRAALTQPRFETLLQIAQRFGLGRLHGEWRVLTDEGTPETRRAAPIVERILRNIEKGFSIAAQGN
jgi:hypothetical protein